MREGGVLREEPVEPVSDAENEAAEAAVEDEAAEPQATTAESEDDQP